MLDTTTTPALGRLMKEDAKFNARLPASQDGVAKTKQKRLWHFFRFLSI